MKPVPENRFSTLSEGFGLVKDRSRTGRTEASAASAPYLIHPDTIDFSVNPNPQAG
jgi:hypothetical protein